MAAALVVADGAGVSGCPAEGTGRLAGTSFTKMTGSGNDFVVFDGRTMLLDLGTAPELIEAICHRGNGIGADGVVVLEAREPGGSVGVRYFNRDGSEGALCGNATLCSTALAASLGLGAGSGMVLDTGDGAVAARMDGDRPSIRLRPVREVREAVPGLVLGEGSGRGSRWWGCPTW